MNKISTACFLQKIQLCNFANKNAKALTNGLTFKANMGEREWKIHTKRCSFAEVDTIDGLKYLKINSI